MRECESAGLRECESARVCELRLKIERITLFIIMCVSQIMSMVDDMILTTVISRPTNQSLEGALCVIAPSIHMKLEASDDGSWISGHGINLKVPDVPDLDDATRAHGLPDGPTTFVYAIALSLVLGEQQKVARLFNALDTRDQSQTHARVLQVDAPLIDRLLSSVRARGLADEAGVIASVIKSKSAETPENPEPLKFAVSSSGALALGSFFVSRALVLRGDPDKGSIVAMEVCKALGLLVTPDNTDHLL